MAARKRRIIQKIIAHSKKQPAAKFTVCKPVTVSQKQKPAEQKKPEADSEKLNPISLDQSELDALFKNHPEPAPAPKKEEEYAGIDLSQDEIDKLFSGHKDPASVPVKKEEPEVKKRNYTFSNDDNADIGLSQNEIDALFRNHSIEGKPAADGKSTVIDYDPKRLLTPSFSVHKSPEDEKILDQEQIDMLLVEFKNTNKMDEKDLNQDEIDALLNSFSKEKAFTVKKES